MAYSSSSSDYTDTEHCDSETKSNLSLSVGYFPYEDTFIYETPSCEDTSCKGSPIPSLPPIQGTWRTESRGRLLKRQDQIQDKPEQFCKLSIPLAWDVDVGSNNADSIANWDLNGDKQWIDKYPKERKLTLSRLNGLLQKLQTFLENQKDDDSVFPESTQEEDFQLSSSSAPDMVQMISQATSSHRTSAKDTSSISSEQPEKGDTPSDTQAISCLNCGCVFRWLRKHILGSLLRRQHRNKPTGSPHQLAPKKRHCRASRRIHTQESL
ncbi:uncharacterized protein C12orf71 homolog [Cynocephalus volans]|uniref:uncharacterized protein C12orf71 homolog n=1 Tax=Cynocephalus volans TaxID=110931 RepID=UPI002FCC5101